ncbi:MAG TPA: DUF2267 domain-containing protein [Candidatus Dormibacteraeota bacterium]|nr:DUF2267 domain-containing protein [Candidatus Dormibacteraeota bacterium]
MTSTHVPLLDSAVQDTYAWLNDIMEELAWEDRHRALQALRGVLHALRDELTIEHSAHLAAQLPTLIRGIYFESWKPGGTPARDRTLEAFLNRVRPSLAGYTDDDDVYDAACAVFKTLAARISEGEGEKVREALPKAIREIWDVV